LMRRAVKLYRRVSRPTAREAAAAAPAFLYVADADHERFLRTRCPRLNFDPRDKIGGQMSVIGFRRWFITLSNNVEHLTRADGEAAAVAARGRRGDVRDQAVARGAAVRARAAALLEQARIPLYFFGNKWERD